MSKIYKNATELIGNTPIMELCGIEKKEGLQARILAKLEYFNPCSSSKDRVGAKMIEEAEAEGILKEGSVIIEPTSGNTGIGLCMTAAVKGYRCIIVMPESMSIERRKIMSALGAELVLTDGSKGMNGAIEKANELSEEIPNSFLAGQFTNPANPKAHYETTGPEILRDTDGMLDFLVCGVGTGGTISGTGRFLKENIKNIKVIAVEPSGSAVLSGKNPGPHGLQGIGAGFIPDALDTDVYDEVFTVTDKEAYEASRLMARTEGILVGISSGAALCAAIKLAKKEENKGKSIAVILPDSGDRYLSTDLF